MNVGQWSEHRAQILAGDSPLLRARLALRPGDDPRRISLLKAHSFDCLVEQALLGIEWCKRTIQLVFEPSRVVVVEGE